jgi:hypothetical protein
MPRSAPERIAKGIPVRRAFKIGAAPPEITRKRMKAAIGTWTIRNFVRG